MRGQQVIIPAGSSAKALIMKNQQNNNESGNMIALPKKEVTGAQDTIYLCNFRVSVDGEWLCLKELQDLEIKEGGSGNGNNQHDDKGQIANNFGIESDKCEKFDERDWVNYYCRSRFSHNFTIIL